MNIDEQLSILLTTTQDLLKVAQIHEHKLKKPDELMSQLATQTIDHAQNIERYFSALEKSRRDFEFRLNALIDSQIAREDDLQNLKKDLHGALQRISKLENQTGSGN